MSILKYGIAFSVLQRHLTFLEIIKNLLCEHILALLVKSQTCVLKNFFPLMFCTHWQILQHLMIYAACYNLPSFRKFLQLWGIKLACVDAESEGYNSTLGALHCRSTRFCKPAVFTTGLQKTVISVKNRQFETVLSILSQHNMQHMKI